MHGEGVWQLFLAPSYPELLNNQIKQLIELFWMAKSALQDLCIQLWSTVALPSSFFGLLARLR
jgi:hypothetical protein